MIVSILLGLILCLCMAPQAHAEGTKDLVANGGYRPYTERYNALTQGENRLSVMHVYLKQGETAYFGTSVSTAKLYEVADNKNSGYLFSNAEMGTSFSDSELTYLNTADVYVAKGNYSSVTDALPYANGTLNSDVTLIDLPDASTSTTPGYIYDSTQEAGGVDVSGTGTGYKVSSTNGLTPVGSVAASAKTDANAFTAPSDGVYTVVFFSSGHTRQDPVKTLASNTTPFAQTQRGGTVASWDISVYDNGTLQTGRVFTSTLFLNMGGNVLGGNDSLDSTVYAVTNDGYKYKVDFNGMDPYGFMFFANNRGLLTTSTNSSLYHGVRSNNNQLSDIVNHDVTLNKEPSDSTLDETYNLFYESPSSDALTALGISDPSSGQGGVSDLKFTGTDDSTANEGYVGKGGTFSFTADANTSATSYQIELDFSSTGGGTVVLSNALKKGTTNTITWDGKDANGNYVPAGTYQTLNGKLKLKGGEVHFPLLDVEQNHAGIKIGRINGTGASESSPDYTVYFNNSSSNAGDTTSPWTLSKNWEVGNQTDATAGVSSENGAMAFTNTNTKNSAKGMNLVGDGDQCALDVWAYYNRTVDESNFSFKLVDTTFTVTKAWDRGTETNPKSVTMTLMDSDGNKVTTDATGTAILNPVTYDTTTSATYTWEHLDATKTYHVVETAIDSYTTAYGNVTGSATDGYAQTVTNTLKPTSLTINKVWDMNGSNEAHPTSVDVHVYTDSARTQEITGSPFTLNETNNWTITISDLDPMLTYYVYEDPVTGYSTYGDGQASGNANDGYTSTIANTFNSGDYMSVAVYKIWKGDGTYSAYQPSSVKMTLLKDGQPVTTDALGNTITNPVTLNAANSWYYVWPALLAKDTSSTGYTVSETDANGNPLQGYTSTFDGASFGHNFGFLGMSNEYKTTTFTVNKSWDNGVDANAPTSVTMQLQQSVDGGTTYTDYGSAVDLDEAGTWKHQWTDLPTYTAENKQILYRAVETSVTGYTAADGGVTGSAADGYTQTFTNTYGYTNLTVNKTWDHGTQPQAEWPSSAVYTLYNGTTAIDSCTLSDANSWTYTFEGLPRDGSFSLVESSVDGYATTGGTVTGNATDGYTASFKNTYTPTTFTATKVWDHGTQAQADWPGSVTLQLYADGVATGAPVTLTSADADVSGNWVYTWTDLDPSANYTVSETAVDGYGTTVGDVTGTAADGYAATITNTFDPTTVTVTKTWDHGTQDKADWPASVTVHLYKNGTEIASFALNEANGWKHTFTGLASGATYTVTEDDVTGYTGKVGTMTGSDADGWTVDVSNTYDAPPATTTPATTTPATTTPATTTPETPAATSPATTPDNPAATPVSDEATTPRTGDTTTSAAAIMLVALLGVGCLAACVWYRRKA
ncbi:MAG: Cna B-type domain-containing protein [Atopobiaceae bacterium]|nr:Cna B-type domain-containing protein [Atopobiaceae bacterium]